MNDEIKSALRRDPVMDNLIDKHGYLTITPADNEYERLCISIINQQLSTASAAAIQDRVLDTLGRSITPQKILNTDSEKLRDDGLSRTKVEYMQNAATAFKNQDLSADGLRNLSDDEVIDKLTDIKGIGEWTARMYLLFVLGREDVLPLGDLGIRNGIKEIYADGEDITRQEMREIGDRWRPYRSYGTRYIWAEYESK